MLSLGFHNKVSGLHVVYGREETGKLRLIRTHSKKDNIYGIQNEKSFKFSRGRKEHSEKKRG